MPGGDGSEGASDVQASFAHRPQAPPVAWGSNRCNPSCCRSIGSGRAVRLRHQRVERHRLPIQRPRGRTAGAARPRHGGRPHAPAGGRGEPRRPKRLRREPRQHRRLPIRRRGRGAALPKSPAKVAADGATDEVAVSPDGQSVYVTNILNGSVSQYDVDADGRLSPKSPATVAAGVIPRVVAVSPDGQSVYVTNGVSDTVSQYDVDAGGRLSPKSPATVANRTPTGVAVSPDGKSVYVGTESLNANLPDAVSQYDVGAGGKLSPKSPATVTTGYDGLPFGVAVSPDGQSVYVTDAAANHVVQYDVGAGGKLSPKTRAELDTGAQPSRVAVR